MEKKVGKKALAMLLAVCLTVGQLPLALGAESTQDNVFQGELEEPDEGKASVKVTLKYQYSPTGGMAGINAHAPETVEFFVNEDGTTTPAAWPIPYYDAEGENDHHDHDHNNLEGFRVVLNAAPLNALVKVPPTGSESPEELENAMNRGDFNPREDVTEEELTAAWIAARTFTTESGLEFQMVDKDGHAAQGSAALVGPKLILKNPGALTGQQEVTLEVNYRRDNGTYTVNHWKLKPGAAADTSVSDNWEAYKTEERKGRIGAMTHAEAEAVPGYVNLAISQQPIQADGSTAVDIYYVQDNRIRVAFDTAGSTSGEIARQIVEIGGKVKLSEVPAPTRTGYVFGGWQYEEQGTGTLHPVTELAQYDGEAQTLELTSGLLDAVQLHVSTEEMGVSMLRLYPKWEPGTTKVRVVFWTEDLTGADDVDSREKGEAGELSVVTHPYTEEGAAYSNMGYYQLENVLTNCELEVATQTGKLVYTSSETKEEAQLDLKERLAALDSMKIKTSYQGTDPKFALTDASGFYTLDGWAVTQMDGSSKDITREGNQAADSGTTVVNVYYTRNIYQLKFIYSVEEEGHTKVAFDTGGFVIHDYDGNAKSGLRIVADGQEGKIPAVQTITAKYGADLRDIWPCRNDIQVELRPDQFFPSAFFISWCTTMGPYAEEARRCWAGGEGSELRKQYEPTIMGVYGAMSADIIADPAQHLGQEDYQEETGTHKLYAFWWRASSYYRYNHCYEVPGVTQSMLEEQPGVVKMVLDGQSENDIRNIGYLIPADGDGEVMDIIGLYGFDDLRRVRYDPDSEANKVIIDDEGEYYAFRVYNGKCYALSRQVNAASTNIISAQNPSARAHMRRLNTVADHSTKYQPSDGAAKEENTRIGTVEAPYDLFFYYDRIPYQVIYSVGSSDGVVDLGTKELYYGAKLSPYYDIELESGVSANSATANAKTNGEYALQNGYPNGWKLPTAQSGAPAAAIAGQQRVCPDRNPMGTTAWRFKGWAMDLAGMELLDSPDDWSGVVSGDLHLYAQWKAPEYTVEFDWNGGHLAVGSDAEYVTQSISANSTLALSGQVPTPVRSGCYLTGWKLTAYKPNAGDDWRELAELGKEQDFNFDMRVRTNMRLQAQWSQIAGAKEVTYVVRHVLAGSPDVKLAEDQTVTGSFVPGSKVWGSPIKLGTYQGTDRSGYVPTVQNAWIQLPETEGGPVPVITISYRPPAAADKRYTVRFVESGAGREVLKEELSAAEAAKTVYAGSWQEELNEKGYWLADANGARAELKSDALVKTLSFGGETTADFPVAAQVYDLEYQWPDDLDEETKTALAAGLPKSYTPARGVTTLPKPGNGASYTQDGKTYYFKSWKLTRGTLNGETDVELPAVTIAPESRGALTFEAQWSDTPVQPPQPSRPGGNTSGGNTAVKPEDLLEREKHEAYIVGRSGGLAAPEDNITRAEVATIFYRLLTEESRRTFATTENPFPDVSSGDWFFTAAVTLAKAKIVEGYPDGTFAPSANITRGEFAAIAARFLSEKYTGESHFSDLDGHWAREYVDRAAQAGWIKGYPDGTFRPDAPITRAEAITLVNGVLGRAPHKDHLLDNMTTWPDNMDQTKWYYLNIQEATNSHEYTWQTVNGQRVEKWSRLTGDLS